MSGNGGALTFAYYVTGHGFGHATRVVEVVRHLIAAGHVVHVVTGAPDYVYTTEINSPNLHLRKVLLDCGAVQADALTVDCLVSLEKYAQTAMVPRATIMATEVEWLKYIKADLVSMSWLPVTCIVLQCGREALPYLVISIFGNINFRNVFPFHLLMQIAEDYSHCELVLRLPGYCPSKIGYGIVSEALAYKLPFVFVRRDYFNEEPFLRNMLEVASNILQDIANGKCHASTKSGVRRLHDAIILGYQLQRAPGKEINIPEWYSMAENEVGLHLAPPNVETNGSAYSEELCIENFEILHGELHGLSDTVAFLNSLSNLASEADPGKYTEKHMLRDQEEFYVTRAPGRLDVMGGIADYSGSLVLQVSLGSDLSNRAPTFDMDLSDMMNGEQPISYEEACKYFAQDPSQRWAAYVAGTVIVLMSELGVRFPDSISILVSSAVPEGKGVSSSAAVEVATMFALAAAHGLDISPRDIALLCQKVENYVVGAPCGVMDQMTSACGEANKLLAMVCQPAEVKELVTIPSHIRFWGFDSGIRHRYEAVYAKKLPQSILGNVFLEKYIDHEDMAFKALLTAGSTDEQLHALGELMYQCHYSYNDCGLGSDGTDRLVELVQEIQHKNSAQGGKGTLFGAKITGGGSGGSVCVIGRNCVKSSEQILRIQERYKAATGYFPYVFEGSSPGAGTFGYLKLRHQL
ncbi:L-arabinokinase [Ananas comosus]|uniref:L-arabinokinase n=1 Tax=Ananas comosus TaxID=4615 RepID=A0A199VZJ7_ANACO|nr:L-arabinokinase [Ananas comosus]